MKKLRSLVKKVIPNCNHCKRFRVKALPAPTKSLLPDFRAQLTDPFTHTGVDFAGPILYRESKNDPKKAYIALFTCSATRALHLRLCKDLSAEELKRALKEFVARRGTPRVMVSDNGKTFVATSKWLNKLKKNEELANYSATQRILWKFNLSRAPWWGGFFEGLIGIMKRCLAKIVGRSMLEFVELGEVLLDIDCTMNNRPLCYQGEEFENPVITPNVLNRGKPANMLGECLESAVEDENLPRRMVFIAKSKEQLRKRWLKEYLYALEERNHKQNDRTAAIPAIGKVVLLREDVKDKAQWRLGRVAGSITGKDGTVRGLKIKLGSGYIIERPLQLVCDLEIGGEDQVTKNLNPKAEEFVPRNVAPRKEKETAKDGIAACGMYEEQED